MNDPTSYHIVLTASQKAEVLDFFNRVETAGILVPEILDLLLWTPLHKEIISRV